MASSPKRVRDLMRSPVRTVERNDRLQLADEAMQKGGMRHLPVLDGDGELAGILSRTDLFRGALLRALGYGGRAEERMLQSVLVKEVMTEPVRTIGPDATLREAAALMLEHRIGCLPVLEQGKLVGIVSESDLVRQIAEGG